MKPHPVVTASLVAFVALVTPRPLRAQALQNNDYAIDLFQGPILAPIRVTGIAGAYAGYAEGIPGMVANAAAPAVREPSSVSWLDVDLAASASLPLLRLRKSKQDDFDNSGDRDFDYSDFLYATAGAIVQAGPIGVGINGEGQRYTLTGTSGPPTLITVGKFHLLAATSLYDGQLMLGGGARGATLGIASGEAAFTIAGLAPEAGLLVRPNWQSFRLGATFRLPVEATGLAGNARAVDPAGIARAGGLALPDRVVWPWELEVGIAVQVGPRPLNPAWPDPREDERAFAASQARRRAQRAEAHRRELAAILDPALRVARARKIAAEEAGERAREVVALRRASDTLKKERRARYWNWPRQHLLLTAELLVTGAVQRGVSLEAFLGQNQPARQSGPSAVGSSGAAVNYSPRFGIETEPVPDRLHTRFGSYYEPSRYGRVGRQHFTFGADMRLLHTTFWGLLPETKFTVQASFDVAPRYQSFSFSVGTWR